MRVNQEPEIFDIVTGFVFFLTSMFAVYRTWRAVVRRVGRHSTHWRNRAYNTGVQLRYYNGRWQYGKGAYVA